MKTRFKLEELENLVYPESLVDVLNSLSDNGMLEGYYIDFRLGDVIINIPKNIEIKEIMAGFQEYPEDGRKRSNN